MHVLYATETGTAGEVAEAAVAALTKAGVDARSVGLEGVSLEDLAAMDRVAIVCATAGEGEMPTNAESFWKALDSADDVSLNSVEYAVCALGDSDYEFFCAAGKQIDARLEERGAHRMLERVDCDFDYEEPSEGWIAELVRSVAPAGVSTDGAGGDEPASEDEEGASGEPSPPAWDRRNPFPATIAVTTRLSGPGSTKDVRHYEVSLAGSGMTYAAGDSLAVTPVNDPELVDQVLRHFGADGDQALFASLSHHYEVARPSRDLLAELGRRSRDDGVLAALKGEDRAVREKLLRDRDTLDLLRLADVDLEIDEFLAMLRPLQHRDYSIASSPLVSPDSIDLTVAIVRYSSERRDYGGVCSTYLADRLPEGDTAGVFIRRNTVFRPPTDDDAPMIMVGPGTGVAPFRAFLQERRARGAKGQNWLFFGDRHREHDFLYGDELQAMHDDGVLTRLDLAFSRDEAEKVYVQDRMREQGAELYRWLDDGGYFYVCGDAERMAPDVDAALHDVVAEHGGFDAEGASDVVDALKREKRYVRDVY